MKTLVLLVLASSVPAVTLGQAVIAGSVTDSSGASMAGVIVAEQPCADRGNPFRGHRYHRPIPHREPPTWRLCRHVHAQRLAPAPGRGRRADGVVTHSVDAVLDLGSLTETIIVTSEGPVVDVRSVTRETTLSSEVVKTLPTVRSYNALLALVPGVVTTANDIVTGTATTAFPTHGGRVNEGRLLVDGLNVGSPRGEFRDQLRRRHRRRGRGRLLGSEPAGDYET